MIAEICQLGCNPRMWRTVYVNQPIGFLINKWWRGSGMTLAAGRCGFVFSWAASGGMRAGERAHYNPHTSAFPLRERSLIGPLRTRLRLHVLIWHCYSQMRLSITHLLQLVLHRHTPAERLDRKAEKGARGNVNAVSVFCVLHFDRIWTKQIFVKVCVFLV